MAVLQMQHINIYALKKDKKQMLELLQRRGVVEITDTQADDEVFYKEDVSEKISMFERHIHLAQESQAILEKYVPKKKALLSMLEGKSTLSEEDYEQFCIENEKALNIANDICMLEKQVAEQKAEILRLQTEKETLSSWTSLDIPLNYKGTKYTSAFIGTLPSLWTLEMVYEQLAMAMPVNVDIISSSNYQTCIFVICVKEKKDDVFDLLRSIGFSYVDVHTNKSPKDEITNIENQIILAKKIIQESEEKIKSYDKQREKLMFLEDYSALCSQKYEAIGHLMQTEKVFMISGYISKNEGERLNKELVQKFDTFIELEDPSEDEDVPVILENNGFSRPLEGVVEAYSPPGKGETDPTMVMSLFYYALFGLMLSDAIYGFIIALACAIGLIKYKHTLEDSMKNTLKMYLFCGISTVFWGVMFGSYLGDIVDIVSETFFGQKVSIPALWFYPVNEPMRMLVFSMLIGVIHLYTGLGMKLYACIKQKDYKSLIYDVIFWFILLTSCIMLLLSAKMFVDIAGLSFILPPGVAKVAAVLAVISAAGITLTNGRESKNPFKRFLKGLYALYGITGYLSDVLSYSRLLALGLATGVICTVINKMAAMVAKGPIGVIIFVIILVFGHLMNLAINALGAYVHTNRLQYVEFFGKFYDGGGRMFEPFKSKTKYYKIKE